ncbi:hypothetical protein Molly5_20 [Maribacter phage Molly_5]|uniref:Uncharacterized protein n=2 Tax=Mollyvirus TaxID=2948826 RepID=A0A8E4UXZ5_9CAUD|nr:hypothetical protein M1M29_gp020 [Maribacter phage Molly_1]YP_010357268.1 hypothetical protein M1M30_gp019 [Maribacter phage Colly_1]QQO97700.1 hypothetical protein Molly2_20 [Maribacter phage Molly_2]QQO97900.1 hypothetical protein Molly3_20 [Maribacter phage Molly_3]QQO98100.1 hypothetical protein Molly4_20 [Maribacter phage Molly_4]QQO98300.1 hypothetical protein Molly5_20 [Maribacter phage Molly_5]QQO97295.1 hypothetical protein Colly1_19 [Maribacter phage Colly_1]
MRLIKNILLFLIFLALLTIGIIIYNSETNSKIPVVESIQPDTSEMDSIREEIIYQEEVKSRQRVIRHKNDSIKILINRNLEYNYSKAKSLKDTIN